MTVIDLSSITEGDKQTAGALIDTVSNLYKDNGISDRLAAMKTNSRARRSFPLTEKQLEGMMKTLLAIKRPDLLAPGQELHVPDSLQGTFRDVEEVIRMIREWCERNPESSVDKTIRETLDKWEREHGEIP